ncbi:MAG TPA: hypothetical protein VNB87_11295, partial [Propionibacteriaceae bacterium]|nr:hypothetical protein [Propionibacteriaceae bacterium]
MAAEGGRSVHAPTSTPLRLARRSAGGSWSLLLRAGDQCGNALGYGGPQRPGEVVTPSITTSSAPGIAAAVAC